MHFALLVVRVAAFVALLLVVAPSVATARRVSDAAGLYFATDNLAPTDSTSPAWAWDDISATGTALTAISCDDCVSPAVPLGFTFRFYGADYTQIYAGSNGFITFSTGAGSGCCGGAPIPTPGGNPTNFVAPYWTDLYVGAVPVRYQTLGAAPDRRFVITYERWDCYGARGTLRTLQAVFFETINTIEVRYQTSPACASYTATAGISNNGNSDGIQWAYGSGLVIADLTVVRYSADRDGDGIPDLSDLCPDDPVAAHQDSAVCDDDGDGLPNVSDNCSRAANPLQEDCDGDLEGDACDADDDNDGTPDATDCDDCNAAVHPGAIEVCNTVDDDCNALVDELPPLSCGTGACRVTVDPSCVGGVVQTCTPGAPGPETCNLADDDCNGIVDDGLEPLCGIPCTSGTACASGFCFDGVCCQTDCSSACPSCALAGQVGSCVQVPAGTDPRNDCPAIGTCANSCTSLGSCERTCLLQGAACADPLDCSTGLCTDGVCCDRPCDGICIQCNLPGRAGRCLAELNGTPCADSDICNGDEVCASGFCAAPAPLDCDDAEPCTEDSCDATAGCMHTTLGDGTVCGVGDMCTGQRQCGGGACRSTAPLDCDDGDPCTIDGCNAATGCAHDPRPGCTVDGGLDGGGEAGVDAAADLTTDGARLPPPQGACGCRVPGTGRTTRAGGLPVWWLAGAAIAAGALRRRRHRG